MMPYQPTWNNPYLPQTAQPSIWSMPMTQTAPVQQPVNGITKVNGRESAMQYALPPNSTSPALFDMNGKTFYVVSTDGTGMRTVEAFDFTPHVDDSVAAQTEYVSKSEFARFADEIEKRLVALDGLHAAVPAV